MQSLGNLLSQTQPNKDSKNQRRKVYRTASLYTEALNGITSFVGTKNIGEWTIEVKENKDIIACKIIIREPLSAVWLKTQTATLETLLYQQFLSKELIQKPDTVILSFKVR